MDFIIWIFFFMTGCVSHCKTYDLQHTPCIPMDSLKRRTNHHKIECNPGEMIYIARQNMRYGGSTLSLLKTDEKQCTQYDNITSKECLRSVPADFDVDFTSYFNASQNCNRMRMCTLTYNDYYHSVIEFLHSCALGGNFFQQVRNMEYYECLLAKDVIHVGNNTTVNTQRTVYLVFSTRTTCYVKGKIKTSRILEQAHIELRIKHDSNQICTEWNGVFHYNKELDCVVGLAEIFVEVNVTKTNASPILWIEIKGSHLQIECREDLFPEISVASGDSAMILVFILGGVGVALIAVAISIVVFVKMKFFERCLSKQEKERKVRPTSTVQYQVGNRLQSKVSEEQAIGLNCAISNTDKKETSVTVQDGNYSLIDGSNFGEKIDTVNADKYTASLPVLDGNYSLVDGLNFGQKIDTINTDKYTASIPVPDGNYSLVDGSNFGEKIDTVNDDKYTGENEIQAKSHNSVVPCFEKENTEDTAKQNETENTDTDQIIGNVTGDVYASVCKRDNLEDSRITGPKGDIYTTVSMALK